MNKNKKIQKLGKKLKFKKLMAAVAVVSVISSFGGVVFSEKAFAATTPPPTWSSIRWA